MKLSEIRTELLREHVALREQVSVTCTIMDRWVRGESLREQARASIAQLTDAFRQHNANEEALLHEYIKTVDAWGPARAAIMGEQHIREHEELYAALMNATMAADAASASRVVVRLLDRLLDHMAREEKVFLGEDVLCDEVPPIDAFGG
jgi:hypothetical protein